ncbi:MAG: beta-ketoacyl synthase N-terminal-like domain-containing protein, partial [Candidatus Limnocylindria bacterium]
MATEHWQRPSSAQRGERRVVITGTGAVTPIGNDVPSFWESL